LAVATLLTLVFLPALYVTWFRIKRPEPEAASNMHPEQIEPPLSHGKVVEHHGQLEDA
jgi:multidrug efflux pump